jgi:hypothetical protein
MKKKSSSEQLHFYKKIVKVPIYYGNLIIIFSNDNDKVEKTVNCNKGAIGYLYAFTFHGFVCRGAESWAVCYNFWTETPISIGTITHEAIHAAHRILHAREIEPDFVNDEAEAYLAGWIADQVQEFMIKCKLVS